MSLALWILVLLVLVLLGVNILKMDAQYWRDLTKVWQIIIGFKNFQDHLHCDSSDHSPLFINLSGLEPPPWKKNFRFEEIWISNGRCGETVEASWCNSTYGEGDDTILKKVEKCGKDLTWWNRNIFGNVRLELGRKRKLLIQAKREAVLSKQNSRVRKIKAEINTLLDREARMWSQRSHVLWLAHGDSNIKFFHTKATQRYQKNLIGGIRGTNETWQTQPEDISTIFLQNYQNLFSTANPIDQNWTKFHGL